MRWIYTDAINAAIGVVVLAGVITLILACTPHADHRYSMAFTSCRVPGVGSFCRANNQEDVRYPP